MRPEEIAAPRRRSKPILIAAILLLGAALRLGYGFARPPQPVGGPLSDPDGYVGLATSVAERDGLYEDGAPSAHREPAYPVFLGTWFKIFGRSYGALLAANVILGTAALWLLFRIGTMLFGEGVGLAAAGLASVYPPFVFYAAQPLRETSMLAASGFAIWSVLKAYDQFSNALCRGAEYRNGTVRTDGMKADVSANFNGFKMGRRAVIAFAGAGAANALAGLTNTTFLPFGILAPVVMLVLERGRKLAVLCAGMYLIVFAGLYAPWPLRNHRAFGAWIVGSTAGAGSTFYLYLTIPEEVGGTPRQQELMDQDLIHAKGAALPTPLGREQYFWRAGFDWVKTHPASYVRLVAWRFFEDSWRIVPRPRAYAHSYLLLKWVSLLTDGWIIPLGLLGMILACFKPWTSVWVYLFVFSVDFSYSLVFTMLRYRISIMPWMILFAVVALQRAWDRWRPVPA